MRPAARYAASIGVLDQIAGGVAAEQALIAWARGARYAGSKDRAAVRDHVYDVLRRRGRCAALGGGESGRALILGLLRLSGVEVAPVFSGEGHGPAPLSAAEAAFEGTDPGPEADIPDWARAALARAAPGRTCDLFAALCDRAPVWLRANRRRGGAQAAQAALDEDGIATHAHRDLPEALEVTEGARRLRQSRAYQEGLVELQDLSPHIAVARLDLPGAGGRILDYCAGGGGKSLAMADRSDAQIIAHDAAPRRMADLPARVARAACAVAQTRTEDLIPGGYDMVLADVPCSGSGTWRRDPDAKWRLRPADLEQLNSVQDQILTDTAPLVAPGGRLVYMTCSLFERENGDRIAAFLERVSGWKRLSEHLDTPLSASDGFYACVLARA